MLAGEDTSERGRRGDFGDPDFAQSVRDGVARVEDLIAAELSGGDTLMTEVAPCT